MSVCVYKDSRFAKFFGNHSAPAPKVNAAPVGAAGTRVATKAPSANIAHAPVQHPPMPTSSLALFCVRDSLTIFASFNLPPLLAPSIPDWVAPSAVAKSSLAQFLIPSAVQLVSTPIHLLGLDLYNRPHLPAPGSSGATVPVPASERWQRVSRDWMPSFAARVARIAPAFGVGGVLNARARAKMMEMVEGKE
ncbi:hypothetical protein KEM55_004311 [Ascosphaera atra]|nr:hypothetical protein KEM55_004311 [Ascosphaera atra]